MCIAAIGVGALVGAVMGVLLAGIAVLFMAILTTKDDHRHGGV